MPRLTIPPSMPSEVSHAHEILGSRARTTIIRFITINGPSSVNEFADELNAHREAVSRRTATLGEAGIVSATFRQHNLMEDSCS